MRKKKKNEIVLNYYYVNKLIKQIIYNSIKMSNYMYHDDTYKEADDRHYRLFTEVDAIMYLSKFYINIYFKKSNKRLKLPKVFELKNK
jgi:hypothetical protein